MKFKIVRSKFLDTLKKVQNIVGSKGTMMILQNVLLEAKEKSIFLTTTDLDISICSSIECEVIEEGTTTLPVKLLFNSISKACEGLVEFEIDANDHAMISAGSAVFKMSGLSSVNFPPLPIAQNAFEYVLSQARLHDMLLKCHYAAAQQDGHRTLKGVLMSFKQNKVTVVATDGRRLALAEDDSVQFPSEEDRDIILPIKVVSELLRTLGQEGEVRVSVEKTQIAFNLGDTRIYSKLVDEIYPNYILVIPGALAERVTIDRQLLLNALERTAVMKVDESNATKLTFEANQLTVSSTTAEAGSARDVVPIRYDGPHIDIEFNPNYVMDPLRVIDDDEIFIELTDGKTAAMLKCSTPFLYVMMPLNTSRN